MKFTKLRAAPMPGWVELSRNRWPADAKLLWRCQKHGPYPKWFQNQDHQYECSESEVKTIMGHRGDYGCGKDLDFKLVLPDGQIVSVPEVPGLSPSSASRYARTRLYGN